MVSPNMKIADDGARTGVVAAERSVSPCARLAFLLARVPDLGWGDLFGSKNSLHCL
jgi:hypothetical protein